MMGVMVKSKIHRATVTEANLADEGSLAIDADLMRARPQEPAAEKALPFISHRS